ncbi:alpha/beta hydrolase family protein [Williamsia deligens]|uniref:Alpha/beta hydrolase n=1 Tax=Williamsia deligens TaxID=321325 RepID=A0ABW3G5G4_9NOCA|nr:alpha/beta hydrolase [Williamsia deligens]MCP2193628.1 esterase FrsA [Williamsia deligens]
MAQPTVLHKLLVTACAITRTTDLAARMTGARPFLPALFALRYANMGGFDRDVFAQQLSGARSFRDDRWCTYWNRIAAEHTDRATGLLRDLAAATSSIVPDITDPETVLDTQALGVLAELIAPAATLFADHGPQPDATAVADLIDTHDSTEDRLRTATAFHAVDSWVKAMTYCQVSAFPGHSPQRMQAYWRSRHLFEVLIGALAPSLDLTVERVGIPVAGGQTVTGHLILPPGPGPHPVVLTTNGLEGTAQELAIPQLRYRDSGMAMFLMEMPGSYAYTDPMRPESEVIYHDVIDHLVADDRLDADRIAMVGVSFGGYWTARLAATDPRLACAIACGAPTHRSFSGGALGTPQVILGALADTVGAKHPLDLMRKLAALSIADRYGDISMPLLVINGDTDTLMSTQDSVDLAEAAPQGTVLLYPDDDHCAMGHYREWLDYSQHWLFEHLPSATSRHGQNR